MIAAGSSGHTPVLTREVCDLLTVGWGQTVIDATIGVGGHAQLFVESVGPDGMLIGFDVDPANLEAAEKALAEAPCRVVLRHTNFATLRTELDSLGIGRVDVLFADLGVSSTQLSHATRGMSFQVDGPLDMRMDPRLKVTAADLVNRLKERELGDLLYHNAQEFAARKIARRICEVRRDGRITGTKHLSDIISRAVGVDPSSRRSRIHPATRTFLALRMAVNAELDCLEAFLRDAPEVLRAGGRIGVISFHSGEDRLVKRNFRKQKQQGVYELVTKRPIVAGQEERRVNPRSRSAKLRVAVRMGPEASAAE